MSVEIMTAVWKGSQHSRGALLMLLAIADHCNINGEAWPSVASLAAKTRMKPRNANYLLEELQASGELVVKIAAGPHGTNLYRIAPTLLRGMQRGAGLQDAAGVHQGAEVQGGAGMQGTAELHHGARGAALECANPLHQGAPKPSLNHQEPPVTSLSRPAAGKLPTCPHNLIRELYHEVLPELPRATLADAKGRKVATVAFWRWVLTSTKSNGSQRASTEHEAIVWIRAYFQRARSNDFIMNRTTRNGDHANWKADYDYLLSDKGKKQVIEKTEVTE